MLTNITSPTIKEEKLGENLSRFVIGPLYPGYGHTLGNALRRILLSSLTGAAITSVKIEGTTHEFSTLPGVREDVLEICLNLKKVRFKTFTDEKIEIELDKKGPTEVKAADFKKNANLEIVNPDLVIAHLNKEGKLSLRATVERGRGYWTVEQRLSILGEKLPLGTIGLDTLFSPIVNIAMEVEDIRVGQMTNYNELKLQIETDGTITPKKAIEEAIEILYEQIISLKNPKETQEKAMAEEEALISRITEDTDLSEAGLSPRVVNALFAAGLKTVADIIKLDDEALKVIKGLGPKGVKEVNTLKSQFKS